MTPDLLNMPEAWIGIGILGMVMYAAMNRGERKKRAARLKRVSQTVQRTVTAEQASLRRENPSAGSFFAEWSSVARLQAMLELAGMKITPKKLLRLVVGLFIGTLAVLLMLGKPLLVAVLVAVLISLGIPRFVIKRKLHTRKMLFLKLFPEAIDLIVRGLRAGLPVGESFHTVAKEIPAPVGDAFATISQQTQLGVPVETALSDAASKLDITELDFFVTTIILQRETGGNLGEILSNLSDMLRQRQMMKLKIFALSSEARASAYIVGSLPFFVFGLLTVVSPDYLNPFYDDYRGNVALGGAIGIMTLGGFIMAKMTQLEI